MYADYKGEKYKEGSRYDDREFKRLKTYSDKTNQAFTLTSVGQDRAGGNQEHFSKAAELQETIARNPEHYSKASELQETIARKPEHYSKASEIKETRTSGLHQENIARNANSQPRRQNIQHTAQSPDRTRAYELVDRSRTGHQFTEKPRLMELHRQIELQDKSRNLLKYSRQETVVSDVRNHVPSEAIPPDGARSGAEARIVKESRSMLENLNLEKQRFRLALAEEVEYQRSLSSESLTNRSISSLLEHDRALEVNNHGVQHGQEVQRSGLEQQQQQLEQQQLEQKQKQQYSGYSRFQEEQPKNQYTGENWRCAGEGAGTRMSTPPSDQYCLRWNSYETNILDTFGGLLDSEALSDVTLFCEGESFKAHRLVLAACSTHFSKIFSTSPVNGQIIVILDGTRADDLQILLQFMYRGVAFLPSDRIESVLRTGEVLQVKGLFNGDGITRGGREGARPWTPPTAAVTESLKKEVVEPLPPRTREASPIPTGRIALAPESPISHNLPIFPTQSYPRPFSGSIPSLYPNFPFSRPESSGSKPTSSSVLSFTSTNSGLGSPTAASSASLAPRDYKFTPREREETFEPTNGKPEQLLLGKHGRSPPTHRPASEGSFDRPIPRSKLIGDSEAEGASPLRRFDEPPPAQRMKTEGREDEGARIRTFSGEMMEKRETLSRMSSHSTPATRRETDAAEDLRTSENEERIKRENNQDFLRRLAQVNSERETQIATIQKMDLLRQATAARGDHFLAGAGGFGTNQLTVPLGIPASELARIAQTVPDPNHVPGEPTSGTGTKLKCPFCERTYGYETNLRAHIRQRHQGIRVPCPFCHRSFTRNNTVRRHIAREHRHQVGSKMLPTKFGQTKVLPDQNYADAMQANQSQQ